MLITHALHLNNYFQSKHISNASKNKEPKTKCDGRKQTPALHFWWQQGKKFDNLFLKFITSFMTSVTKKNSFKILLQILRLFHLF
jgi:hypothetical protein